MSRLSTSITFVATLSLLALQLSGVHMHVDENGYVGVPEVAHSHSQGVHHHDDVNSTVRTSSRADEHPPVHSSDHPHDHDYDGSKDVSLVELSGGASKMALALIGLAFMLPILLQQCGGFIPNLLLPVQSGRRARWRPPLRAPPRFA